MNAKTKKLLLGIAALAVIAVIVFFFPQLLPSDDGTLTAPAASGSTAAAATTAPEASKPTSAPPAASDTAKTPETTQAPETEKKLDRNGSYTSKEDVALYIHQYGRLPSNFITKAEAGKLGWTGGSLEKYAPGKSIGGDRFGNYEGTLPEGDYHECDIDTLGADRRGAKRLVYSDDGRIYYTEDHYESFTLLYGEED